MINGFSSLLRRAPAPGRPTPSRRAPSFQITVTERTVKTVNYQYRRGPTRLGREYLIYVLWAITPEGHARNLGEIERERRPSIARRP